MPSEDKKGERTNISFLLLVGMAFLFSFLPIINAPFMWITVFLHETSHGVAALLTGGTIEKIELHLIGSGLCYTRGGIRFIILNAGYIGTVIWGFIIYEMADEISAKNTNLLAIFFSTLITISAIFYGRDIITWGILFVLFSLFVSILKLQDSFLMKLALKFIGIYVLLDSVRAPLYLIDGRHYGDGAKLSDVTGIPEMFWIILWLAIGISGTYYLWKLNKKIPQNKL